MRRSSLVALALIAGPGLSACDSRGAPDDRFSLFAPARIQQALTMFGGLEATVQTVPRGGVPGDAIALTPGDDGVSFSGFIELEPGEFTAEVVFTGVHASSTDRVFLGRWASDAFTVTLGSVVDATFSGPIDTIGRPEDGGDADGDRLSIFDELIWGTDPARSDTDGDGLPDGSDCDPTTTSTMPVFDGGSLEDCDADGARRPDTPIGPPGNDCNDHDPAISPSARDVCGDDVNADCNAATCPEDGVPVVIIPPPDPVGPSLSGLDPADGESVGCHKLITVTATVDAARSVNSVELLLVDSLAPLVVEDTLTMNEVAPGRFVRTLNYGTTVWPESGAQAWLLRAQDDQGTTSTITGSYQLRLDEPTATISAPPAMPTAPFDLTVTAQGPHAIREVSLRLAPSTGQDLARDAGTLVGTQASSPAVFTIDPTALADGDYVVWAMVEDEFGNRLQPEATFTPSGTVDSDWLCSIDTGTVPLVGFNVGPPMMNGFEPAKMRDHLDEAIALAAGIDPNAPLVVVRGWGIQPDGFIALNDAVGGEGKWWAYEFFNFTDERFIEILWNSAYYGGQNPEVTVTENYAFGFSLDPMLTPPAQLVDSDVAATAYAQTACGALTGIEDDLIRYESNEPFTSDDVVRIDVGNDFWKGTASAPVTDVTVSCN